MKFSAFPRVCWYELGFASQYAWILSTSDFSGSIFLRQLKLSNPMSRDRPLIIILMNSSKGTLIFFRYTFMFMFCLASRIDTTWWLDSTAFNFLTDIFRSISAAVLLTVGFTIADGIIGFVVFTKRSSKALKSSFMSSCFSLTSFQRLSLSVIITSMS